MPTAAGHRGDCPLCLEPDKRLVRSHIVPKSFTDRISNKRGRQQKAFLLNHRDKQRHARPGGIYQEPFLCMDCEQRLGRWDDYAGGIFFRQTSRWQRVSNPAVWTPHGEPGELRGWQIEADASRILLFFASFLWRAHATNLREFANFDLGENAEHFRRVSVDGTVPADSPLGVVLVRYEPSERTPGIETAWSVSGFEPLDGCQCCALAFGGWHAYLKADARPFTLPVQVGMLKPGQPLLALSMPFDGSKADLALRRAAENIRRTETDRAAHRAADKIAQAAARPL